MWKCKFKVNANCSRHIAVTALLVTRVRINNFGVLNQGLVKGKKARKSRNECKVSVGSSFLIIIAIFFLKLMFYLFFS